MTELRIITEPSVFLVGRPILDEETLRVFLEEEGICWHPDGDATYPESLCEVAGRVCYMSFKSPRPGGNKAYLDNIIRRGHGSVLEHAVWNFVFTGISRSLSHELVRHRIGWSYSMLSQRYVDESDVSFVMPHEIANDPVAYPVWLDSVRQARLDYCTLVYGLTDAATKRLWPELIGHERQAKFNALPADEKTAIRKSVRQTARSVLSNATETKIFATANARAIRHFIEMRASRHADVEIRRLACKVHEVVVQEAPSLFGDYRRVALPDGTHELVTDYRKV